MSISRLTAALASQQVEKLCADIDRAIEQIEAIKYMFEITSEDLKEANKSEDSFLKEKKENHEEKEKRIRAEAMTSDTPNSPQSNRRKKKRNLK